ncbi:MAG: N-acetylmuramoyl-L-alanine amidase [Oscillospiraceae bacterium]|nr:N-acetylmuramoyl-L-alanine amidase [Oscillospiraceae bacterium]
MFNRDNPPLIVVDPGHGGWDNGASWEGRLEKDDNLRLGLEVYKVLGEQGIPAIMTRDSDVFVTLADRATIANNAGADLFVSLHRNSYPEQTPTTNGVENYIYLTAPEETAGKAAQLVLEEVVEVGVQANRGVSRGDYYVLRKTQMPAMLLEMGFIINEIDNQLFDEHLQDYAKAIVRGIMQYFGLAIDEDSPGAHHPYKCPPCPSASVMQGQLLLGDRFGLGVPLTGYYDNLTRQLAVIALQLALNRDTNAQLIADGMLGAKTLEAFGKVYPGSTGNVVLLLQLLLMFNEHSPGRPDGMYGPDTEEAVRKFQQDRGLAASGAVDADTLISLVGNSQQFFS